MQRHEVPMIRIGWARLWPRMPTGRPEVTRDRFVGSQDSAFQRVCRLCERLDLRPPEPDDPQVTGCRYGAFVSSIIAQLHTTSGMAEQESLALIRYALEHSLHQIECVDRKAAQRSYTEQKEEYRPDAACVH